jgi:hypothetical protein
VRDEERMVRGDSLKELWDKGIAYLLQEYT